MEGRCTKATTVMARPTTSTTTTGGPAWAQIGLSPRISTHPRSLKYKFINQGRSQHQHNPQQAVVSSPNLEHLDSTCVDDIHEKSSFRPFMVKSQLGWLEDKYARISTFEFSYFSLSSSHISFRSLRLTCVLFEDKANPILNLYKSKLRKKNDFNGNVVIYNY